MLTVFLDLVTVFCEVEFVVRSQGQVFWVPCWWVVVCYLFKLSGLCCILWDLG